MNSNSEVASELKEINKILNLIFYAICGLIGMSMGILFGRGFL